MDFSACHQSWGQTSDGGKPDYLPIATYQSARTFAFWASEKHHSLVKADWKHLQQLAEAEIEATLAALPAPLREQAAQLPITLETAPNAGLQADGIEPDTLGLFTGAEFADEGAVVLPPQIILFLENLWDFAEGDEAIFAEEVRTTFLHELGHYLGLDEEDLMDRELD